MIYRSDRIAGATIRPIETPYAGRLFRSRLEARWAVFFSTLGLPWMYEAQGFALGDSVAYLPDFFLPHLECFIEIKAAAPTELEALKASRLAKATRTRVFIFFGLPGYQVNGGYPYGQLQRDSAFLYDGRSQPVGWDNLYTWCVCPCGVFGIEYCGRSERIRCGQDHGYEKHYTYADPLLLRAYDAANRARFTTSTVSPC